MHVVRNLKNKFINIVIQVPTHLKDGLQVVSGNSLPAHRRLARSGFTEAFAQQLRDPKKGGEYQKQKAEYRDRTERAAEKAAERSRNTEPAFSSDDVESEQSISESVQAEHFDFEAGQMEIVEHVTSQDLDDIDAQIAQLQGTNTEALLAEVRGPGNGAVSIIRGSVANAMKRFEKEIASSKNSADTQAAVQNLWIRFEKGLDAKFPAHSAQTGEKTDAEIESFESTVARFAKSLKIVESKASGGAPSAEVSESCREAVANFKKDLRQLR
jgi:hypothetical protein